MNSSNSIQDNGLNLRIALAHARVKAVIEPAKENELMIDISLDAESMGYNTYDPANSDIPYFFRDEPILWSGWVAGRCTAHIDNSPHAVYWKDEDEICV